MQQIISASKYSIESIFVLVLVQSLSLLPHLTPKQTGMGYIYVQFKLDYYFK